MFQQGDPTMSTNLKIFSGGASPQLAQSICDVLGMGLSRLTVSRFSNDNLFVQIRENVRFFFFIYLHFFLLPFLIVF